MTFSYIFWMSKRFMKRFKRMKKKQLVTVIIIGIMISIQCLFHPGLTPKLLGKWIADDDLRAVTMEFFKDGKVIIKYREGIELKGTWRELPNANLEINMDFWLLKGSIENKKLILKNNDNEKTYIKLK